MLKKCLLILAITGLIPVYAGDLENALSGGGNVFLYLYTQQCGFCTKFTPRYNKLSKMYDGQYTFVKLDALTPYGNSVLKSYGGRYVPYVLLLNQKKNKAMQISPSCLTDSACVEGKLKDFRS